MLLLHVGERYQVRDFRPNKKGPFLTFGCCRWVYPQAFEKSIAGEIVLITGGGSGIGRLMALKMAKLGAVVVTWDVNTKGNEETAK